MYIFLHEYSLGISVYQADTNDNCYVCNLVALVDPWTWLELLGMLTCPVGYSLDATSNETQVYTSAESGQRCLLTPSPHFVNLQHVISLCIGI